MDFKIKTLHLDDKVSREGVQNSAIVFTHKRGLGWWIWRKKGVPQSRHIILICQSVGVGYHDILCLRAIMGILLVAFSSGDLSYLKRWRSWQFCRFVFHFQRFVLFEKMVIMAILSVCVFFSRGFVLFWKDGDLSFLKRWWSGQFLFPGSKVADLGHSRPGTI